MFSNARLAEVAEHLSRYSSRPVKVVCAVPADIRVDATWIVPGR